MILILQRLLFPVPLHLKNKIRLCHVSLACGQRRAEVIPVQLSCGTIPVGSLLWHLSHAFPHNTLKKVDIRYVLFLITVTDVCNLKINVAVIILIC